MNREPTDYREPLFIPGWAQDRLDHLLAECHGYGVPLDTLYKLEALVDDVASGLNCSEDAYPFLNAPVADHATTMTPAVATTMPDDDDHYGVGMNALVASLGGDPKVA